MGTWLIKIQMCVLSLTKTIILNTIFEHYILGSVLGSVDTELNMYSLISTNNLKSKKNELKDKDLDKQNAVGSTG